MNFLIAVAIVALASALITIRTLVGYSDMRFIYKLFISILVLYAWSAPILNHFVRKASWMSEGAYAFLYNFGFFLCGLAVILIMLILARDFSWFAAYKLKLFDIVSPHDKLTLAKANLYTVLLTFIISFYGFYQAVKMPVVKEIEISSPKISQKTTIALITDLHITRGSSIKSVKEVIEKTNALNPDIIALAGDIIDDNPALIQKQIAELGKLHAKDGVYAISGNHEVIRGFISSIKVFSDLGFTFLMNTGKRLPERNLYIAGIPDYGISEYNSLHKPKIDHALHYSEEGDYKLLLSHTPNFISTLENNEIDLQLSGHTHGGQIFPFHLIAKKQNGGFLAGLYDVDKMKLYVSRGTRFWGPPIRIFAPAEITLVTLEPSDEKTNSNP